jgi:F-type H+-transporting ATPase subunit a
MIPYVFSVTAHVIITFSFSLAIWIAVTLLGLSNFKINFLSMFMPPGSPLILAPLLVFIELLSYTARAISLGVRLAANITSGHILLAIISGFAWKMFTLGGFLTIMSIFPVLILFFLSVLELAVAFIQAYVFTLLACIYLNDGLHLH